MACRHCDLVGGALATLVQPMPLVDWFDLLARRSAARHIPLLPVAA